MNFDNEASKLLKGLNELNKEFPDFNIADPITVDEIIENSLFCFGKLIQLKQILKNSEKQNDILSGIIDSNQEYINNILSKTKLKDLLID